MLMRIALLFSIAWMARLTEPLFTVAGQRDLRPRSDPASAAACSCIAKATYEIHEKLEGEPSTARGKRGRVVRSVIIQVMLLDIVFSLDSVITAIGMAERPAASWWPPSCWPCW